MIKNVLSHFPSRLFILSNILFWLLLNTLSTDSTYRQRLAYGIEANFIDLWLMYIPYWGNWAIVTPLAVALVRSIKMDGVELPRLIAVNIVVMFITMVIYWGLTVIEVTLISSSGKISFEALALGFSNLLMSPMHLDFLVYLAVAALAFAINYNKTIQKQAINNQELTNQLLKVELTALKSQLNPHFLFNTLNTISGLVRLDQKSGAVIALSELSHMFRNVLENQNKQLTCLKNEMEFINSYLAIQKLRFDNKISLKIDVAEESLDIQLPFMLLHTLVENAVQHGSQLESNENMMHLVVSLSDGNLNIRLVNKASTGDDHKGFGIGLQNCHKRLKHIYKDKYILQCQEIDNGYFETLLSLPAGVTDV
jgi:sensor histidine kinase YesM